MLEFTSVSYSHRQGKVVHKFTNLFLLWRGRVSKKTFWLCGLLPATVISVIGWRLDLPDSLALLVLLAAIYIGLMLSIKRSHDLGRTGFFSLVLAVPLLNLWPLFVFAFVNGAAGDNEYGPPDRRFPNVLVDE